MSTQTSDFMLKHVQNVLGKTYITLGHVRLACLKLLNVDKELVQCGAECNLLKTSNKKLQIESQCIKADFERLQHSHDYWRNAYIKADKKFHNAHNLCALSIFINAALFMYILVKMI